MACLAGLAKSQDDLGEQFASFIKFALVVGPSGGIAPLHSPVSDRANRLSRRFVVPPPAQYRD